MNSWVKLYVCRPDGRLDIAIHYSLLAISFSILAFQERFKFMVKHIILWKLKETLTEEEKTAARAEAKRRLENLNGKIDGMISLKVVTDRLPSSNADMMLDSEFETVEALAGYQVNPLHVEAATFVRSVVEARLCLDF